MGSTVHTYESILKSDETFQTAELLKSINAPQDRLGNRVRLNELGGVEHIIMLLEVNVQTGLSNDQIELQRDRYGANAVPHTPPESLFSLLYDALSDMTILILIFAATLSLLVEIVLQSHNGWIEGVAILTAVLTVSLVTATNNYYRNKQFRDLEVASQNDELCAVQRDGSMVQLHPKELVVGDIVLLNVGDCVPADCILLSPLSGVVSCDESSLTGESVEVTKHLHDDVFLLSSSLVLDGAQCKALVIAVGMDSQWGQIKSNLVVEAQETPMQSKLSSLAQKFSLLGAVSAGVIYLSLALRISLTTRDRVAIASSLLKSFIFVTTVVVAAVPEGLPLAVTLTLAYCNRMLYKERCLVRTLVACETMGNVTTICTDKTGTLTENKMKVIVGMIDQQLLPIDLLASLDNKNEHILDMVALNIAINTTVYKNKHGKYIGNSTELALITLLQQWEYNIEDLRARYYDSNGDTVEAFNSYTKQSAVTILAPSMCNREGRVRLIKGASEVIVSQCKSYLNSRGEEIVLTESSRQYIMQTINSMAKKSLRTIALAHEFLPLSARFASLPSSSPLPLTQPPSPPPSPSSLSPTYILDGIFGLQDPLRAEASASIATAQGAGIVVRLMTGDSLPTALSIARECGVLSEGQGWESCATTGEQLRHLSPALYDAKIASTLVIARCSPSDKLTLVSRLSGHQLPKTREEWEGRHSEQRGVSWETHRELLLPGYREEWEKKHPEGGEVVAVTGDGTNDAPSLRTADIGLAMGQCGTKVAQAAADMVLLDDNFSSIVQAILWGRSVYDNVRRFVTFQITANITALFIIFLSAVSGVTSPLNAVQILWLNMVMDPLGALALAVEPPDASVLLKRRPYKRNAPLITSPMWQTTLLQSCGLIAIMSVLLFAGPKHISNTCQHYSLQENYAKNALWNFETYQIDNVLGSISCTDFNLYCYTNKDNADCFDKESHNIYIDFLGYSESVRFSSLEQYEDLCLVCDVKDYTFQTFVFNVFMFYQMFNLWNARLLFSNTSAVMQWQIFWSSQFTYLFLGMVGFQLLLVHFGGEFAQTTPLSLKHLGISIALGLISVVIGMITRVFPVRESEELFAGAEQERVKMQKVVEVKV